MDAASAFSNRVREAGGSPKASWIQKMGESGVRDLPSLWQKFLESDIFETLEPDAELENFLSPKVDVSKKILAQVDEVTDISLPKDQRMQLMTSPKGTLKMLLNSGGLQFIGLSKEPVTSLSPSIRPGVKISLIPPMVSRYNVFFLSEANIQVLGGFSPVQEKKMREAYEGARNRPAKADPAPQQKKAEEPPAAHEEPPEVPKEKTKEPNITYLSNSDSSFSLSDGEIEEQQPSGAISVAALAASTSKGKKQAVSATVFCLNTCEPQNGKPITATISDDSQSTLEVEVSSNLVARLVGRGIEQFASLKDSEIQKLSLLLEAKLQSLNPPLTLIDRGSDNQRRFLMVE